jgi:transposase
MSKRVRYSKEFRFQAARLVAEEGYTIKKAAAHLGINAWTLRDWVRKFRSDGSLPPSEEESETATELRRLRNELAEVTMERDI